MTEGWTLSRQEAIAVTVSLMVAGQLSSNDLKAAIDCLDGCNVGDVGRGALSIEAQEQAEARIRNIAVERDAARAKLDELEEELAYTINECWALKEKNVKLAVAAGALGWSGQ